MLRRIIRRLRRKSQPVAPPPVQHRPEPVAEEEEEVPLPEVEIDTEQLKAWLADGVAFTLLDIRESHELRFGYAEEALLLRMNDIPNRLEELPDASTRLVIYCAAGSRSFGVAHWLREQGWADSWSLESGFAGVCEAGIKLADPDGL